MYVTSTAFLKDDLANIILAIAMAARHGNSQEYRAGFYDALAALAQAPGVYVQGITQPASLTEQEDRP